MHVHGQSISSAKKIQCMNNTQVDKAHATIWSDPKYLTYYTQPLAQTNHKKRESFGTLRTFKRFYW
jgi:hypothetical protein